MTTATIPASLASGIARIDEMADRAFAGRKVPGLVYGVVHGNELDPRPRSGHAPRRRGRHARCPVGLPNRVDDQELHRGGRHVPSRRRLLRLDDPIDRYVPELGAPPLPDRGLTAGHHPPPADDDRRFSDRRPLGDRQQGLDLASSRICCAGGCPSPGRRGRGLNTRTPATGSSEG